MPSDLVELLCSAYECQKRVEEVKVDLEERGFDIVMFHLGTISRLGVGDSSVGGYFMHMVLKLQKHQKVSFLKHFEVYSVQKK